MEVNGPITVVAGQKKRLTFIECPNDINSMIDIGKIADLVLLTVDASFGFEMVSHLMVQKKIKWFYQCVF